MHVYSMKFTPQQKQDTLRDREFWYQREHSDPSWYDMRMLLVWYANDMQIL